MWDEEHFLHAKFKGGDSNLICTALLSITAVVWWGELVKPVLGCSCIRQLIYTLKLLLSLILFWTKQEIRNWPRWSLDPKKGGKLCSCYALLCWSTFNSYFVIITTLILHKNKGPMDLIVKENHLLLWGLKKNSKFQATNRSKIAALNALYVLWGSSGEEGIVSICGEPRWG